MKIIFDTFYFGSICMVFLTVYLCIYTLYTIVKPYLQKEKKHFDQFIEMYNSWLSQPNDSKKQAIVNFINKKLAFYQKKHKNKHQTRYLGDDFYKIMLKKVNGHEIDLDGLVKVFNTQAGPVDVIKLGPDGLGPTYQKLCALLASEYKPFNTYYCLEYLFKEYRACLKEFNDLKKLQSLQEKLSPMVQEFIVDLKSDSESHSIILVNLYLMLREVKYFDLPQSKQAEYQEKARKLLPLYIAQDTKLQDYCFDEISRRIFKDNYPLI